MVVTLEILVWSQKGSSKGNYE